LEMAGVPVKSDHHPGLPHYFWIFASATEERQFIGNLIGGVCLPTLPCSPN
jgi:versiconal hemiacetal acetate esterase